MSTIQNTNYLENKWEEVMEAVEEQDFEKGEKIAQSVSDAGFPLIAREIYTEIATAKEDYEANKTPDDYSHANGNEI